MKKKIEIQSDEGAVVYKGKALMVPIKEDYIIDKSIEVFDDDDPCIIHQSYVIKLFVQELLDLIPNGNKELKLSKVRDQVRFLDIDSIETCTLILEG